MLVALADDSMLLREGLASLLTEAGYKVVGQARDADGLLDLVAANAPDVAIVDIRMPPEPDGGIHAAPRIRALHPGVGVLVLSQYARPSYALELLETLEQVQLRLPCGVGELPVRSLEARREQATGLTENRGCRFASPAWSPRPLTSGNVGRRPLLHRIRRRRGRGADADDGGDGQDYRASVHLSRSPVRDGGPVPLVRPSGGGSPDRRTTGGTAPLQDGPFGV